MKVAVTGANGFVGKAIVGRLRAEGHEVVAVVRANPEAGQVAVGDIGDESVHWRPVLEGCNVIVHAAARVHQMGERGMQGLEMFRKVNTDGTLRLAQCAAETGVHRLIFLSSVKAMGELGDFCADDACAPQDAYGLSKYEAELALRDLSTRTGLEVIILRLPLVYGAGVSANFKRLLAAVQKGTPLPFGKVANKRSLVYVENLVSAVSVCTNHSSASGRTYMVSDGEDVSTPELIRRIAHSMNRPPRLLPIPAAWLKIAAGLVGKGHVADRLLGSLTVDSSPLRAELGWTPPYTLDEGLRLTADWLVKSRTIN